MNQDFKSKKHGYSANSYLKVLDAEIALSYTNLNQGSLFMQDNASIYTANKVK